MEDNEPQESEQPQDEPANEPAKNSRIQAYWRANQRLIITLLVIWAVVSIGMSVLGVEWLNQFKIGQLPFGFWMAQQGSIYVFVILIFVYAFRMDKLDRDHDVH